MLEVLSITGVVFVLISLGFAVVRLGVFDEAELAVLSKFIVKIVLPALVFNAVTSRSLSELFDGGYVVAYTAGSMTAFAIGYAVARFGLGRSQMDSAFGAMAVSVSNSGFIGYPTLLIALPEAAPSVFALNVVIENAFMFPLVLFLVEHSRHGGAPGVRLFSTIAARVLKNPLVIALIAGLIVSLLGFRFPFVLAHPVKLIADSSAAISLIVIGGMLAALPLNSVNSQIVVYSLGKVLLHPLCVALAFGALYFFTEAQTPLYLAQGGVICAAIAQPAIYVFLSQAYRESRVAAVVMGVSTFASFFTLTAALYFLR